MREKLSSLGTNYLVNVCTHSECHGALVRSNDPCVLTVGRRVACRKQLLVENSLPMFHQRSVGVYEYIWTEISLVQLYLRCKRYLTVLVPALRIRYHVLTIKWPEIGQIEHIPS